MKRMITSATNYDVAYEVTVRFDDYIGSDIEIELDAPEDADEEDLLSVVQEQYADELFTAEIIYFEDDGYYEVEITFDDQIDTSKTYSVYSKSVAHAYDDAIEEAKNDLDVVEFHKL